MSEQFICIHPEPELCHGQPSLRCGKCHYLSSIEDDWKDEYPKEIIMNNYVALSSRLWPFKRLNEVGLKWEIEGLALGGYRFQQQSECERTIAIRLLKVLPSLTPRVE